MELRDAGDSGGGPKLGIDAGIAFLMFDVLFPMLTFSLDVRDVRDVGETERLGGGVCGNFQFLNFCLVSNCCSSDCSDD